MSNNLASIGENTSGVIAFFATTLDGLLVIGANVGAYGMHWIIVIGAKILSIAIFSGMGTGLLALSKT